MVVDYGKGSTADLLGSLRLASNQFLDEGAQLNGPSLGANLGFDRFSLGLPFEKQRATRTDVGTTSNNDVIMLD